TPGAVRGLIASAYGDLALASGDPSAAVTALREAEVAFATGSPMPWRLARALFALARALVATDHDAAIAEARLPLAEFPRRGHAPTKAAIEGWITKQSK